MRYCWPRASILLGLAVLGCLVHSNARAQTPACESEAQAPTTTAQATYYHPSLVGEPMANGQPYDPANPLFASTNRYPLGTVLLLTRPDGGARTVVQVADRGSPRLDIDLSEAAFRRLAPLTAGRVVVCVERLGQGG